MTDTLYINNKISEAFTEFQRCISFLGIEKTSTALRNFRLLQTDVEDKTVSFVVSVILNEMDMKEEDFFISRSWSTKRVIAIGMAVYIFSRQLDFSAEQIAGFLKKTKACCWKNMKAFNNLNAKYEQDKIFLEKYQKIQTIISQYIKDNPNAKRKQSN